MIGGAGSVPCGEGQRFLLEAEGWREMAASVDLPLRAMWGDEGTVIALLADAAGSDVLVSVAVEAGFYPALSPFRPEAAGFERMIRDLWGFSAVGGIDARPLLDFGHWKVTQPMARPAAPYAPPEPPQSGVAHKGTLALLRGKSPRAAARFAARVDGAATVAHSIAFARAAEAASGGAPIHARARGLREIMATVERMAAAVETIWRVAEAAGAGVLAGRCALLRAAVARAAGAAFGHRLMMDVVVPGGVSLDIAEGGGPALLRLRRDWADSLVPALAAEQLAVRLRDLPVVAERVDSALDTIATGLAALGTALDALPEGGIMRAIAMAEGEGIGRTAGPSGEVVHWLRLESGQIAGGFILDPAWTEGPACAAARLAVAEADRALVDAAFGVLASGMEL